MLQKIIPVETKKDPEKNRSLAHNFKVRKSFKRIKAKMKIAPIALATLSFAEAAKEIKSPYHDNIRASYGQYRPTAADRLRKVDPKGRNLSIQRKAEASPPMPDWADVYPIIDSYPNPNDPLNQVSFVDTFLVI